MAAHKGVLYSSTQPSTLKPVVCLLAVLIAHSHFTLQRKHFTRESDGAGPALQNIPGPQSKGPRPCTRGAARAWVGPLGLTDPRQVGHPCRSRRAANSCWWLGATACLGTPARLCRPVGSCTPVQSERQRVPSCRCIQSSHGKGLLPAGGARITSVMSWVGRIRTLRPVPAALKPDGPMAPRPHGLKALRPKALRPKALRP